MTAIVGILCQNGIVIGSDSSATFGQGLKFRTIEQPTEKLCIIEGHVILAGTGAVGFDQRFCEIIKEAWSKKVFQNNAVQVCKLLSKAMIEDMAFTHSKPGQYGAMVGFSSNNKPQLCEFDLETFQPELKSEKLWYCSMGSTQYLTDPFLGLIREIYWGESLPTIQEGEFAAAWALKHAISLNVGGVNEPIHIGVLESKKGKYEGRQLGDDELDEMYQHIEDTKSKMKSIFKEFQDSNDSKVEDTPRR